VPKQKDAPGAAKRFKVTAAASDASPVDAQPILTKKTTKRKRHLRKSVVVSPAFAGIIKEMLHL